MGLVVPGKPVSTRVIDMDATARNIYMYCHTRNRLVNAHRLIIVD